MGNLSVPSVESLFFLDGHFLGVILVPLTLRKAVNIQGAFTFERTWNKYHLTLCETKVSEILPFKDHN